MRARVGKNAALNVVGVALPALAGLAVAPVFLQNIGADRLGIFTLALGIIGFSSLFDLGLSRALTQTVASAIGRGSSRAAVAGLVRRTAPLIFLLGIIWGMALVASSQFLVGHGPHLPEDLLKEARASIMWLACALPITMLSSGLIGVLEGMQLFGRINLVRVPASILSFVVPAAGSFVTTDVGTLVALLVMVRAIALAVWLFMVGYALPQLANKGNAELHRIPTRSMWKFTGWLTLSGVVGPLMVQADRFYLASLFAPAAIAYYAVPLDSLFRATAIPQMAMNAVFPALAHSGAASRQAKTLLRGAAGFMLVLWGMPLIVVGLTAKSLLVSWMGLEFASHSLPIVQWIVLGIMINGFAHIPFSLLQSAGRADVTAKLHVLELPIYILALVALVASNGIVGAAQAWTLRIVIDTVALYVVAAQLYPASRQDLRLINALTVALALAFFFLVI